VPTDNLLAVARKFPQARLAVPRCYSEHRSASHKSRKIENDFDFSR